MTDIPLLVHLEKQLTALDRLFSEKFLASEKAVEAAFEAADVEPRLRKIEAQLEGMQGESKGMRIVWYFVFAFAGMITGGVVVWGVLA